MITPNEQLLKIIAELRKGYQLWIDGPPMHFQPCPRGGRYCSRAHVGDLAKQILARADEVERSYLSDVKKVNAE